MITRRTKDVGMREHIEEVLRLDGPIEEAQQAKLKAFLDSIPVAQPGDWLGDAGNRENARRCRAILATVGLSDDGRGRADTEGLRAKGLDEASAQWLAAHWLAEYNSLMRQRERFERKRDGLALCGEA
jgi:hypothetical protein